MNYVNLLRKLNVIDINKWLEVDYMISVKFFSNIDSNVVMFFGHSKAHNMHSSQILLCGSGTKWEIMTTVPLYHKYTVAVHMLMHSL